MKENKYLSIHQVAKILGISRIAVYQKVKKGKIKAIKVGKSYAICEDFIRENTVDVKGRPLTLEEKNRIEDAVLCCCSV